MRRFVALASVAALAAVAAAPAQGATPTFGPAVPLITIPTWGATSVDVNRDGKLDVALTEGFVSVATKLRIAPGNGDETFALASQGSETGSDARDVEAGDLTGDGISDLAVVGAGAPAGVRVLQGNGVTGFGDATARACAVSLTDVGLADVLPDPGLEIIATDLTASDMPGTLCVYTVNADGSINAPAAVATSPLTRGPRQLAIGDVNNDGKPDAVISFENSTPNGGVEVRLNNGSGAFPTAGTFGAGTFFNTSGRGAGIALGDLNGDGRLDIVQATGETTVSIALNTGGAILYGAPTTVPIGADGAHAVAVADFDGDGKLDIAVGTQDGKVSILAGNGNGTFGGPAPLTTGLPPDRSPDVLSIADFDQDDRPDLIATSNSITVGFNGAVVLLNRTLFPPATVVTGAASNVSTDFATLSGTMDNDNRRGFWRFEIGETTAYGGSTTEQALGPNPDPLSVAVNVPGLKPGTTYHYRLVGRTLAGGVVNGADATFTTAPTDSTAIKVSRATFNVKYTLGVAKGEVVVRGNATAGSKVTLRLLRVKGSKLVSVRNYDVGTIQAGAFTKRLKVPGTLLPGKFAVRAVGTSGPVPLVPSEVRSKLAAPAEGIVRQSFASSVRNGPPALRLPGKRAQVHATFVFTVQPKGKKGIVARWFLPTGRALPGVAKPNAKRVGSVISVRAGSLQSGRYRCELRVKGKLVGVVRVRLG